MVDFDNESTVTVNKKEINVMIILETHYYINQLYGDYRAQMYNKINPISENKLMGYIDRLYMLLRATFKARLNKTKFKELVKLHESNKIKEKLEALEIIQDHLYTWGPLRFDIKNKIDTEVADNEDESKGL